MANYHFSEDDTVRIMRCLKDLKNLNLMFQTEQDVSNNVAKPNSQHSEPNCNIMLKNPEDFNTSDENVKGDDR